MQNHTKVGDVYKRLQEYREGKAVEKQEEEKRIKEQADKLEKEKAEIEEKRQNAAKRLNFLESSSMDLLNIYPLRKWRQFNDSYPSQCWIITGSVWLTGQLLAIHVEFGLVFTLISLFLLMFLHMGVRAEDELSAYSVFNPNCERLLGQLTPEHFERDMLMQRREDEN